MKVPTFAGDGVGTIPGSHVVKTFSALKLHFHYITSITKASPIIANFTGANEIKTAGTTVGDYGGCWYGVITLLFVRKSVTKTDRYSGALT
jgi:hypothetical protein